MHFFRCTIPGEASFNQVVSRLLSGSRPGEAASVQTLVACGRELRPLIGADALGGLELRPPLQLFAEPAARDGEPAAARRPYEPHHSLRYPVWDPHTSAVYMIDGHAIVRLSGDNTVTVVAGSVEEAGDTDGPGGAARFRFLHTLAVDGAGSLYAAAVAGYARKVQLPGMGLGPGAARAGASPGGQAAAAATAGGEAVVSTLQQIAPSVILGLAFHDNGGGSGSLIFASESALYRLPLDDPTAAPLLLAGAEGGRGAADGRGAEARFRFIAGIALDGDGNAYVADLWEEFAGKPVTSVRRVAADGTMTTIVAGVEGRLLHPAVLPSGCLALSDCDGNSLQVLGLGLKLPACHAAAAPPLPPVAPAGPPPRSLPADLGALLDRQPDGTADVTIVVGGRSFHAHRALLSARSDYFRQILGSCFAEGGAQELSLPEADPDAFELWLRFMYTGAADIPTAQAAAVAELADRLLLPELREQAAAVVEASVSASTVADLLLWAEARGPAFSELLSRLKAWYVDNHEAVVREAAEEVQVLMVRSPGLMLELVREALSRPAKRPREC